MDEGNGRREEVSFDSPDMIDFMTRHSDAVRNKYLDRPYVHMGRTLSGDYAIVYIPRDRVDEMIEEIGPTSLTTFSIVLGLLGRQELEASGITQVQAQPYLQLRGQGVLLGFVDTGIDYTNDAFRYEDGSTRIKYLWDQSVPGGAPETYNIGTEYTEEQINEALRSDDPYSVVPHRDTVGHGTFLASVAGGRGAGEYTGAAPDAEFVIVKLRKANQYYLDLFAVPPEQENAYSSSDVMLGVEYIIDKSLQLHMPVAICIGLGANSGSHDGHNVLDEFLAHSANHTGVSICVAAGNEALARHHTQGVISESAATRDIEVQSVENAYAIDLHIWNDMADRLSASVTSPGGEVVGRVPPRPGLHYEQSLILERSRVSVSYYYPNPRSGSQSIWVQVMDPTPGIWRVTLYGDSIVEGRYHAWLPMTGFVTPGVEFLNPVPNTTITGPGTAVGVMTVGGYSAQTKGLYAESSWGPTRLPALSPDFTAPAVEVGGVYPVGYGTMTGTSVAAAIATGASALMLQWGIVQQNEIAMNTYLIRSFFIRGCERDPGIVYPNEQWGYGRLNLMNTFVQLRSVLG